jgi:hypothetical protein
MKNQKAKLEQTCQVMKWRPPGTDAIYRMGSHAFFCVGIGFHYNQLENKY